MKLKVIYNKINQFINSYKELNIAEKTDLINSLKRTDWIMFWDFCQSPNTVYFVRKSNLALNFNIYEGLTELILFNNLIAIDMDRDGFINAQDYLDYYLTFCKLRDRTLRLKLKDIKIYKNINFFYFLLENIYMERINEL